MNNERTSDKISLMEIECRTIIHAQKSGRIRNYRSRNVMQKERKYMRSNIFSYSKIIEPQLLATALTLFTYIQAIQLQCSGCSSWIGLIVSQEVANVGDGVEFIQYRSRSSLGYENTNLLLLLLYLGCIELSSFFIFISVYRGASRVQKQRE